MKNRRGTKHEEITKQESIRAEEDSRKSESSDDDEEEVTVNVGLKDSGNKTAYDQNNGQRKNLCKKWKRGNTV